MIARTRQSLHMHTVHTNSTPTYTQYMNTHTHTHTPSVDEAVSTVGVSASDVAEGVADVSLLVTGGSGRPESVVTVPVGG